MGEEHLAVLPTSHCTNYRTGEVPGGEVWVHCRSGYRASIAASILDAAAYSDVRRRRVRPRDDGRPTGDRTGTGSAVSPRMLVQALPVST